MKIRKSVAFAGTCSARSEVTLVSKRLMRPFATKVLHIRFPSGCLNLMTIAVYYSPDDEAPTSGAPSGISVLQDYGQVGYVRGEGVELRLEHEVQFLEGGMYLKVYANNEDYYDHSVDVVVEIEVDSGEEE